MGRTIIIEAVEPWYKIPRGGTQQAVATLTEGLVKAGATVYVLGPSGSELPRGAKLVDMGRSILDRAADSWTDLRLVQRVHGEMVDKIEEVLRRHPNDQVVLHVHWSYAESGLLFELLRREIRIPTVLTKHTVFPSLLGHSALDLGGNSEADIIRQFPAVAISKFDRSHAQGHFKFIEAITHGLTDVYFNNRLPNERLGGGCLGTYSERKGFLVAYEAAMEAGETRFESAGLCNTPEHRAYRAQIKRRFLDRGFGKDLGTIDLAEKLVWYPSLRYFLAPIQLPEPLNLTVLEALASGTPVIASDLGAMREMIRHGENGFLVRPGDTRAIAAHIQHINNLPPQEMNAWALRIRAGAMRDYSSASMAEKYLAVYRRVLREFGR